MTSDVLDGYRVADDVLEVEGRVPVHYFTYTPNFGDLLSPWIVAKLTGREVTLADRSQPHYTVIGSILNECTDTSIAWGTGTYGSEGVRDLSRKMRITAVRGPLTRSKLSADHGFGLAVPEVYGDAALLAPLVYRPEVEQTHEYGFVVRWSERRWARATYGPDIKLIDFARTDIEGVIRDLLSCRKIITSSLHGLIVADAYGIPNAWLASGTPRGGEYKFYDYFASVKKFRTPQQFDASAAPQVTGELLESTFEFDGRPIDYDPLPLLDACPFLQRATAPADPAHDAAAKIAESRKLREPNRLRRTVPGVSTLLPSLGFFGGTAADHLSVRVSEPVQEIRLFLPAKQAGQLDLRGIQLAKAARPIHIDAPKVRIEQSSYAGSAESASINSRIRTTREQGAWAIARFDAPVRVDEVRVLNQLDHRGVRAQRLNVAVIGGDGAEIARCSLDSDKAVTTTLRLVEELTGIAIEPADLSSAEAGADLRDKVVAALVANIRDGARGRTSREHQLLFALLPTRPSGPELTDNDLQLLGYLLATERRRVSGAATSVRSFGGVLTTRKLLDRVEEATNEATALLGIDPVTLTRKGFRAGEVLKRRRAAHLQLLDRTLVTLRGLGFTPMLGFGTLLGAVRNGEFLPFDDDIDVLVPCADDSEWAPLADRVREMGWEVRTHKSGFHIIDPESRLQIDVHPATELENLLPATTVTLEGNDYPAPAQPEMLLEERYGPEWMSPDRYHGWPRALDQV
ncbi:LicD family protein [Nocardioides albertanoniae]|uniref:LicD family protein n=1 Tax=Nocardioides albertanoniae TaxID=1175486 RepID=A0A543A1Z6_9ACTN|nr:polysaccharide pyruvyl transferase family protein [Nocardioides albertanoniae]TQL66594.1 LicD family protein [Nocardioides albertanoniae]